MLNEQFIRNATIIELVILAINVIVVVILFIKFSNKKESHSAEGSTNTSGEMQKQPEISPKMVIKVLQNTPEAAAAIEAEKNAQIAAANQQQEASGNSPAAENSEQSKKKIKNFNKILNSLKQEEEMKQVVWNTYVDRYSAEGRRSFTEAKIRMEEEAKLFRKDQVQKLRDKLANEMEIEKVDTSKQEKEAVKEEFKPNTAMIIDDNQFSKSMLKKILQEIQIEVLQEVNTGVEAIELAEKFRPEFIFMDIKMADIDGSTAIKFIKRKLPQTIIIVCSNYYDENLIINLEGMDVRGFIQKPFIKENVLGVIREIKNS